MDSYNKAYRKVLEHRNKCKKWAKEFCMECFGGGLTRFTDNYNKEQRKELGLPTIEETIAGNLKLKRVYDLFKKEKEYLKKQNETNKKTN